jgi:hypothetical protein
MLMSFSTASAQETFFGSLDSDLVFNNGVLLQGVTSSSDGVASIELSGSGTLTVASAVGGGFPRLMVIGGTTITSTRAYSAEETNKTSWSGQFNSPSSAAKPGFFDIVDPGAGFASDYEAVDAFGLGLANETFTYSTAAEMVFPVSAQDNQKLYLAEENTDLTWTVAKDTFCLVSDNLCFMSMSSMNKIALIKEKFETCPVTNITNGTVGTAPNCIYTCTNGYALNDDANGCEAVVGMEDFENQFNETTTETNSVAQQAVFENQIAAPVKEYEFPPGHFRYRASGENFYRYLDEEGLTGEVWVDPTERNQINGESDAGKARLVNTSYLSRNPRSAEEQLSAQNSTKSAEQVKEDDESFMSYLITMRNYFGENAQENTFTTLSADSGSDSVAADTTTNGEASTSGGEESGGTFLSSGGAMLPSTGPGIFVTIAVVGFALMMFGARRS